MGWRTACSSKTSWQDSLPAAHPRAPQCSTGRVNAGSTPQPGCRQEWLWVFPGGGAGGQLGGGGSPPLRGVREGAVRVGGWLGGVFGLKAS